MNKPGLSATGLFFAVSMMCVEARASSFALMGIPVIEESAYEAQLPAVSSQARSDLTRTGVIEVI